MCGIAGFLDPTKVVPPEGLTAVARSMAARLHHRGPDDEGTWVDPDPAIGFGFRRLAIIDLTPTGHQPMQSHCGRYVVVLNGEIYNYRDLRRRLEEETPIAWRGSSDTEVLVESIARWGVENTLGLVNGMFAFAVWDRRERSLWLARDRFGEKPLYYGWSGRVFLFGSELKALTAHPAWVGEVDPTAVALFLRFGYVPGPHSIYGNARKLPPAHFLRIDSDAEFGPLPYWSPAQCAEAAADAPFTGGVAAAGETLEALLRDSVAMRMVADVPVGSLLSGGIDSSTVTAMMCAGRTGAVRTYSIGFTDPRFDESGFAGAVANHLGTEHVELKFDERDCLAVLPRLPEIYDEPFADASQLPTVVLSRLARQHVIVSLSGDGGDEVFGGYPRYQVAERHWRQIAHLPAVAHRAAGRLASAVPIGAINRWVGEMLCGGRLRRPGDKLRNALERLSAESLERLYQNVVSVWRPSDRLTLRSPSTDRLFGEALAIPPLSGMQRLMFLDAVTYLPDDLLVKIDRATMATSLETRAPLLDHRIAEFSWSLPPEMFFRNDQGKWLLRQVLHRHVPRALVERPKMGFEPPMAEWLRGPLRDWAAELLDAPALREAGWVSAGPVQDRWIEHVSGKRDWSRQLWNVLVLHQWLCSDKTTSSATSRANALPARGFGPRPGAAVPVGLH